MRLRPEVWIPSAFRSSASFRFLSCGRPASLRLFIDDLQLFVQLGDALQRRGGLAAEKELRELRRGRREEDEAQGNVDVEDVGDARDELHGQKRVPAEVEEVVVDADALAAQDLAPGHA